MNCYFFESPKGIQYHTFKYFPRHPDHKDPPYEPSKLFMLKRIRKIPGTNYKEKHILKHLRLDGPMDQISIIKNTPENNARLYKVKHLIQITPVTFPDGEPTLDDAKSLGATFVNEFGEMRVIKQLVSSEALQLPQPEHSTPGGHTIARHLRMKWLNPHYS
ncbi:hypothetical protein B566_EDAN010231 [Ephemera danica]|nr:hypothetical protein B566_EDAN010231 [Ephemera danica]